MMAAPVDADGERPFGPATKLFESSYLGATDPVMRSYDVAADGRFVMIEPIVTAQPAKATIVVVQNWSEELKQLMTAAAER